MRPKAGNSAEETNGVEGGRTEIKPWLHHGVVAGFQSGLYPERNRL